MNTAKMKVEEPLTQFDLTKKVLNNLSQYDITPTAKLVLLYLTDCYNPKHADVFPKQKTIADKLGISERSVMRAVQELFKAGLILIECKHTNRYILMPNLTSQLSQGVNKMGEEYSPSNTPILSQTKCQNVTLTPDKLSSSCIRTNKKEQINNKGYLNKGGNVYSEDDKILADYAVKHGAKSINAYVRKLKETKSAEKIIKDYKTKNKIVRNTMAMLLETSQRIQEYRNFKNDAVTPEMCAAWKNLGKKLGIKK